MRCLLRLCAAFSGPHSTPPHPARASLLPNGLQDERCAKLPVYPFLEKVYMERILQKAEVGAGQGCFFGQFAVGGASWLHFLWRPAALALLLLLLLLLLPAAAVCGRLWRTSPCRDGWLEC